MLQSGEQLPIWNLTDAQLALPEMVPMRAGAMDGRYIMDWNKDSVADAGFARSRLCTQADVPSEGGMEGDSESQAQGDVASSN